MLPVIQSHFDDLCVLCERYGVRSLELFGSAATRSFDNDRSDLDFVVDFRPHPAMGTADQYFEFREKLERLFKRNIDLVMAGAIRNKYFARAVDQTRVSLYAA